MYGRISREMNLEIIIDDRSYLEEQALEMKYCSI
jgi:hypothetical protein